MNEPILEVTELTKRFPIPRTRGGGTVHALEQVDLTVGPGEIVGVVGESGSGKSTLARCILRLCEPDSGQVRLKGTDITHASAKRLRPLRSQMHMVFQDPYSSLNPRSTVLGIVSDPLRRAARNHGGDAGQAREAVRGAHELLERVGLVPQLHNRYPHELSGGQRQRVGLARSLAVDPALLVADEPVSALDVSVQASILNQLSALQRDLGFSCLFIAHDLATVEYLCDRLLVMYLGRVVEHGTTEQIFRSPKHPYTQALLAAAVTPDPPAQRSRERIVLSGEIPSPIDPPSGCSFHTRCPVVDLPRCREQVPQPQQLAAGRQVRCHLVAPDGTAPDITDLDNTEGG